MHDENSDSKNLKGGKLLPDDLVKVDILDLRNCGRDIPFDLYLKIGEGNFAHVFSKKTGIDFSRLAQYISKGVQELFVLRSEEGSLRSFLKQDYETELLDPKVSKEKKIAKVLNMTEQNMSELFHQLEVAPETAENTKKVVRSYVTLMGENTNTLSLLLKLASHGDYLYYHSVSTAIFSLFIARATGQFSKRSLEVVGLGAFLHDIGMSQLPEDICESQTDLDPAEWKMMQDHPKMGLRMIENNASIPDEVRYIVYQHHESPDGSGYPNGLKDPVIYYPAKVVALADAFSALISERPYRKAYHVEQAIHILQSESGKFDRNLVSILSNIFLRKSIRRKTGTGNAA